MNSSTSSSRDSATSAAEVPASGRQARSDRLGAPMVTIAVALVLLAVYQILVLPNASPAVAESNSQVVILRAQQYEYQPVPRAVLAGSSISGRLPAQSFIDAGYPVANMGLDGLSAAFGLKVILEQDQLPSTVLVEVNTLDKPLGQNGATVNAVRDGFGYELSRAYPPLRAESRPTTLLYDSLRARRNSGYTQRPDQVRIEETRNSAASATPEGLISVEESIQELLDRDVEVLLVLLPTGTSDPERKALGQDVSGRLNIAFLDLSSLDGAPDLYTDGVHLTPPAADAVSTALASFLLERSPQP